MVPSVWHQWNDDLRHCMSWHWAAPSLPAPYLSLPTSAQFDGRRPTVRQHLFKIPSFGPHGAPGMPTQPQAKLLALIIMDALQGITVVASHSCHGLLCNKLTPRHVLVIRRSGRLLLPRERFLLSRSRFVERPGVVVFVSKEHLGAQESGQESGDLGLERRTFLKNCAATWLLVCSTAMAETVGAQTGATSSDAAPGTVIFYNYALAFNPAKSRLALEEKNIKYVEKKVDLFNGQSLEPWYLKLNPSASAPTLVVGSETITESAEIIRWADRQGGAPLGGDTVDRAFVTDWLSKVDAWDGNLFAAANTGSGGALKAATAFKIKVAEANAKRNPDLAEVYQKKIASFEKTIAEPSDPAVAESNRTQLVAILDEAESRLATNKFLAGPEYSAADAIFTPIVYRLSMFKKVKDYLDPRPNVKRYYEEVKKRPSYKTVFAVSNSGLSSAQQILPAVGKILFSKVTGKY